MTTPKKNIVEIPFYCVKTKKSYKKGDEYKGKRTDLGAFMKAVKGPAVKETKKEPKVKLQKK